MAAGKALALSADCFPEAVLGPLPHIYPFIVNNPGEGAQAKRRAAAVIVDHLTPPLTRAETYGPLSELEDWSTSTTAAGLDQRRMALPARRDPGAECAARPRSGHRDRSRRRPRRALGKLDNHLCELKKQIRDGLHVFGRPGGAINIDLLALAGAARFGGAAMFAAAGAPPPISIWLASTRWTARWQNRGRAKASRIAVG